MKEKILRRIKSIMIFILGMIVSGVSVYRAAGKLYASSIDVDTSKMSELGETSNVNLALDYLYGKAASIKSGGPTIYPPAANSFVMTVYMDPTDVTKNCDFNNSVSTSGTKEGCMKWYIYDSNNDNYIAILDHNTTSSINFNDYSTTLATDTVNWGTKDNINFKARIISADEVAKIIGAYQTFGWTAATASASSDLYFDGPKESASSTNDWVSQTVYSRGKSAFAWLYDNTYDCIQFGCNYQSTDYNDSAYWTSSVDKSYWGSKWVVYYFGCLMVRNDSSSGMGVRPVIEIPKTLFN